MVACQKWTQSVHCLQGAHPTLQPHPVLCQPSPSHVQLVPRQRVRKQVLLVHRQLRVCRQLRRERVGEQVARGQLPSQVRVLGMRRRAQWGRNRALVQVAGRAHVCMRMCRAVVVQHARGGQRWQHVRASVRR